MKKEEFTKIGYPVGSELIRNHMKKMVEEGEKHTDIVKFKKSLRDLEKLLSGKSTSPSKLAKP